MISDKGPGPLALQKRISIEMETSEASQVFLGGKSTVHVDRHTTDSEGELLSCILLVV